MLKFPPLDIPNRAALSSQARFYVVGGAVRDAIRGLRPRDVDYVVTGSTQEELLASGLRQHGKSFPVFVTPNGFEVAMARREKKTGCGYNGFTAEFGPDVTLSEDLNRRDFTINSIAYDIDNNSLFDPHHGAKDINDGVLRMTNPTAFIEDPLRALRAARFATRFLYTFEVDTICAILKLANTSQGIAEFAAIDRERIILEFNKAFKECSAPGRFLAWLKQMGVLRLIMPEINELGDVPEPLEHHPEGNTLDHISLCMDVGKKLGLNEKEMWAVFLHDLGKGCCLHGNDDRGNHDSLGVPLIDEFCKKYRLSNEVKRLAQTFCAVHMTLYRWDKLRAGTRVRMLDKMRTAHNSEILLSCLRCATADTYGRALEQVRHPYHQIFSHVLLNAMEYNDVDLSGISGHNAQEVVLCKRAQALT